jgi:hypothetical protein
MDLGRRGKRFGAEQGSPDAALFSAGFTGVGGYFMAQLLGNVRRKMLTAGLPTVLADIAEATPSQ